MINRHKSLERKCLEAFDPPFTIKRPARSASPIIFASPHSGHIYPKAFLEMSQLSLTELRRNEDSYMHELFLPVLDLGVPFIYANFPRSFVDVNRAADELPKRLTRKGVEPTPRSMIGLGVVPEIIAENMPIYDRDLTYKDVLARIKALHKPYHKALADMIETAMGEHGEALLIDCHSMPGFSPIGSRRPDIILGDRNGQSCKPLTLELVEEAFKARGYSVKRNYPYAGGYVTQHYADPYNGVETIQIEINRELYMNSLTHEKTAGYKTLKANFADISRDIIAGFGQTYNAIAAQ